MALLAGVPRVPACPLAEAPQACAHRQSTLSRQRFMSAHSFPRTLGFAVALSLAPLSPKPAVPSARAQVRCPHLAILSLVGVPRLRGVMILLNLESDAILFNGGRLLS